ncbi:hypothetical protein CLIB1423_16S00474 [[Candida] railenensis]|uniref:Uncharacterized protein n=1 Tax=[Candida] railenensis TaxID=45579 RepID=A0A9P0QRU2_9ASCO|nr:hypothetical protein CLIB1423_16S00474 [[Candida] railenensis]
MEVASYEDPILKLARDPDLNKEKDKTCQLIHIINNFPLTERRISKLCQLSLTILQSLEKIELNSKNWQFLSLDINSETHFNEDYEENSVLRKFNNNIASKVLLSCQDFQKKLHRISQDLDFITRSSRTLSPLEFLSDSGTLLTQLTLRNIKLKDELTDKITVAYSRAKLINIGTDLEEMLSQSEDGDSETDQTVATYKSFVVSLLKQLNNSIEQEDLQDKYECLAVISDMEKMFEAFKLEKLQEAAELAADRERERMMNEMDAKLAALPDPDEEFVYVGSPEATTSPANYASHKSNAGSGVSAVSDDGYDSDMGTSSTMFSSMYSSHHQPPQIHSITRTNHNSSNTNASLHGRRDSVASLSTSTILHKTTIAEEMPYLMSAFDSARNFEEDISHYKPEKDEKEKSESNTDISSSSRSSSANSMSQSSPDISSTSPDSSTSNLSASIQIPSGGHFSSISNKLSAKNSLYAESTILKNLPSPSSYLYSNSSLLSKLGIKPQVVTADLPSRGLSSRAVQPVSAMGSNTSANIGFMSHSYHPALPGKENGEEEQDKKDRAQKLMTSSMPSLPIEPSPLTLANLASLTQHGEVE